MAQLAAGSAGPCALVALTVLGGPAWACLLCFTSYSERIRICQTFVGVAGPKVEKCEEALEAAFKGLLDTDISEETRPPSSRALGGVRREGPERPGETQEERDNRLVDRNGGQRLRWEDRGRTELGTKTQADRRLETGGQTLRGTGG